MSGGLAHQIWAWARAEWLRTGTGVAWAVFAAAWTVVASLLFAVILADAGRASLPAGETPMSAYFRMAPWIHSLLLILFVPLITIDAFAARREQQRLEHLLVAGARPLALVLGSFLAVSVLLIALAIPPLLFHLVFASLGDADAGRTLAAVATIFVQSLAIAALSLAASAWLASRAMAHVATLAGGLLWWLLDLFAQQFQAEGWARLPADLLPLARSLFDHANGLVDWGSIFALLSTTVAALALATLGLRPHVPMAGRAARGALMISAWIGALLVGEAGQWRSDVAREAPLAEATRALVGAMDGPHPLSVTLIHTSDQHRDPLHGPVIDATWRLCERLADAGARIQRADPRVSIDLRAIVETTEPAADFSTPLLLVRQGRHRDVLLDEDLVRRAPDEGLVAFTGENALFALLHRWRAGVDTCVWWGQPMGRAQVDAGNPGSAVGAWFRLLAEAGHAPRDLSAPIDRLPPQALLVVPGARRDLDAAEADALLAWIDDGGRLLLALESQQAMTHAGWTTLAQRAGITWEAVIPATTEGERVLPAATVNPSGEHPLVRPWRRDGRPALAVNHLALDQGATGRALGTIPAGQTALLPTGTAARLRKRAAIIACGTIGKGHVAVVGGVDTFSDAHLHVGANDLLARLLPGWLQEPHADSSDSAGLALPPRPLQARRFTATGTQMAWLRWGIGGALPLLVILAAALVRWRRRRR